MDDTRTISALVVLLLLAKHINAFGSGAPDGACENLMPSHGAPPQQSPAPYQITTSQTFVAKGGQISVTLSGSSSPFIGFFMRARQNNQYIGGTFQENNLGSLRCNNQGMTHSSPEPKQKLVVVWTAPDNIMSSPIQFEATFVQQKPVFWTQVISPDVTISLVGSTNTSLNPETTTASFTLTNTNAQDPNTVLQTNPPNQNMQNGNNFPQQPNPPNQNMQNGNNFPQQPNPPNQNMQTGNNFPQQPNPPNQNMQNGNNFPQQPIPINQNMQNNNFPQQPNGINPGFQNPNTLPQPNTTGQGFQNPNGSPQTNPTNQGFQGSSSFPPSGVSTPGFQDPNGFNQPNVNNQMPPGTNTFPNPNVTNSPPQDPNAIPQPNLTNPMLQDPNTLPQPNSTNPNLQNPNAASLDTSTAPTAAGGPDFNGNNNLGQPTSATSVTATGTEVINTNETVISGREKSLAETGNGKLPLQSARRISVDPDCGRSKSCYHNCQDGDACNFFISWTNEIDKMHFQFIYHSLSSSDQWIALGLSHDTVMGDDSVMECVSENEKIHVRTSYNNGKANEYLDDKSAGLSDAQGSLTDGLLTCSFRRQMVYPQETRVFDLSPPYYLMVATGKATSGNKLPHSYERLPRVSPDKVSLQQVASISGSRDPFYPLVKAHGTVMTLAWMFFASCGLVIAKHGRSMFNNSKPFGIHIWFHVHRLCMMMTAFLTILGFILIVIESKGYSVIPETPGKVYRVLHPPLGIILVIGTLINPLMALFRPDPKSPSRPVFRWSHWGIGILAWATSFILLVIGLDLNKSQAEVEAIYVVFAFIVYQIVIDISIRVTLAFCRCFGPGCFDNKHSYDINLAECSRNGMNGQAAGAALSDTRDTTKDDQNVQRGRNVTVSIILVLHMVLSACFSMAVLYFFLRHPVGSVPSVPGQDGSKH